MEKINRKVFKIKSKIYNLIKILMMEDTNDHKTEGCSHDINDLTSNIYLSIQKYMKDVNYDDKNEEIILRDIVKFEEEFTNNSAIDDEWSIIKLLEN